MIILIILICLALIIVIGLIIDRIQTIKEEHEELLKYKEKENDIKEAKKTEEYKEFLHYKFRTREAKEELNNIHRECFAIGHETNQAKRELYEYQALMTKELYEVNDYVLIYSKENNKFVLYDHGNESVNVKSFSIDMKSGEIKIEKY